MKIVSKLLLFVCLGLSFFSIVGCESTNSIRTAYFTDISPAGSNKSTIKMTLQKDSRVDEKYFDIQVRSNKVLSLEINEENNNPIIISFDDTKWKSLTTLMVEAEEKPDTETFKKYKEVQSKTYILKSQTDGTLTFRVVVGEPEENASKTGFILANSKDVSSEFKLNLK